MAYELRISDWSFVVCSSDQAFRKALSFLFNGKVGIGVDRPRRRTPQPVPPRSQDPRKPCIAGLLEGRQCPAIVATGYIRAYVPMHYTVLGTDGYGRSDPRAHPPRHFEVNRFPRDQPPLPALAAPPTPNDQHWP